MVTAGANQAFTNVVLTLLDTASKVVLFKPYYFNHLMAIQMTGGAQSITFGRWGTSSISFCILPSSALTSAGFLPGEYQKQQGCFFAQACPTWQTLQRHPETPYCHMPHMQLIPDWAEI